MKLCIDSICCSTRRHCLGWAQMRRCLMARASLSSSPARNSTLRSIDSFTEAILRIESQRCRDMARTSCSTGMASRSASSMSCAYTLVHMNSAVAIRNSLNALICPPVRYVDCHLNAEDNLFWRCCQAIVKNKNGRGATVIDR